jgi:hypothetical protein
MLSVKREEKTFVTSWRWITAILIRPVNNIGNAEKAKR